MARPQSNTKIPFRVSPMLATLVPRPFHKPNWVYEEKYDGIRILAYKEGNKLSLITRNDVNRVSDFPNLAAAIRHLKSSTLLLDGEVVVFDCLFANGRDLRAEPLSVRRKSLRNAIKSGNLLLIAERLAENGLQAYRVAQRRGFEGVVAKDASSPYVEGRSRYWLKNKIRKEEEFIIGGYTAPAGSRKYFGALLLGAYKKGAFRYVGRVGTGFNEKTLSSLFRKFKPLVRKESPFVPPLPMKTATFLWPKLVAQISFTEWTRDGKLRQPAFLGLREDKSPQEVRLREN